MDRVATMWSDVLGRFRAAWNAQSRQNRMLALGAAGVLAAAGLAMMVLAATHGADYRVLFSDLAPSDASAVTQRLKDDKVPYTLSSDGRNVYVPAADVAGERVAIAGANLIKGGSVGYELFDKTNFGMTEFEEKIDKTRAIEGELERTIEGLDPVAAARVNIAQPEQTLYSATAQPVTASIAITTKPGMQLSPAQVQGITMLVARAVDGLKPSDVTIVDQDGQVLLPAANAADGSADALNLTQEQLIAKARYEANLQASIQSMLDATLGPHRAVARVSTKMDFDADTTVTKTYAPQGTVLSQQSKRESYNGTQPAGNAIGIPATTSNIPTYQAIRPGRATGRYNKSESTSNYDVSEQNSRHINAPGKVLQTSVAVLLNSGTANVAQIRNAVIAAAGLNLSAGDQISVEEIPFNPVVTGGAPQRAAAISGMPLWVLAALALVAGVIVLGFVAARLRARARHADDRPSFDSALSEQLPPFETTMLDGSPGLPPPARGAADLTREQMIEYVTRVARDNPEGMGKLIKLWLAE